MQRFLRTCLAGILNAAAQVQQMLSRSRSPACQDRTVRLNLETMEERLALSAAPALPIHPPLLLPALVGATSPKQDQMPALPAATNPGTGVVDPLRCHCVHGYKWRPRPYSTSEPTPQKSEVTIDNLKVLSVEAGHLVAGGADGTLVLISAHGPTVTPPLQGPHLTGVLSA
jgi:hypothetical protein